MKNIKILPIVLALFFSGCLCSCNDWLETGSNDEVLEDDAFSSAKGFRSALIGIYRLVASENLYGQELTWGLLSSISWNYQPCYAIPKYRGALQHDDYTDNNTKTVVSSVWGAAYNAIANCNNLLKQIESSNANFEYTWEKDMIMAEARGLRALLHFEMLRLFAPAPITGYKGTTIPYVTDYPNLLPQHKSMDEVLTSIIEDLEYAKQTLRPIDVDELRNKSVWIVNGNRMDNIEYVLFQGVLNLKSDGTREGYGNGFFAFRGYRFNYWGATALLARVYSYMRDNTKAEQYADTILNDWVGSDKFHLYSQNPKAASNPNAIDGKRIPEPLIAFWNDKVCDNYTSAISKIYNRIVNLQYLFDGDLSDDYRYTNLYNSSNYRYRVWDGQDASYSTNNSIVNYSNPLIPVLELPEIYLIKAECLAARGEIAGAVALLKEIRDARGCTNSISASDYDSFMEKLVNEANRDFIARGQTWHFLKKLNWPKLYNGTPANKTVPDGWYVLPMPDSETAYY